MAARELRVKWSGDASGIKRGADEAEGHLGRIASTTQTVSGHMSSAFGAFGKIVQSAGVPMGPLGDAISHVGDMLGQLEAHGTKAGKGMLIAGAGITGLGGIVLAAADPIEKAHAGLKQVIDNTGASFGDFAPKIDATVKHMEHFGHGSADTQDAISKLTVATGDTGKALSDMSLVSEIAAQKHESLSEAAGQVVKMTMGSTKAFKEFGVEVTKAADPHKALDAAMKNEVTTGDALHKAQQHLLDLQAVDATKKKLTIQDHIALRQAQEGVTAATDKHNEALAKVGTAQDNVKKGSADYSAAMGEVLQRVKGVAEAHENTFGGRMDYWKAHLSDFAGEAGGHFGKAMVTLGPIIAGVGAVMDSSLIPAILSATVAAAPWIAAIAGIVAVGLLVYELVTHWREVFDTLKRIVGEALGWIKDTVSKGIDDVTDFFKKLPGRILDGLGDLGNLLIGAGKDVIKGMFEGVKLAWEAWKFVYIELPLKILELIGDAAKWLFDKGKDVLRGMFDGVRDMWDHEVHFFSDLAGKILGAIGDAGRWLYDKGKDVLSGLWNGIKEIWNREVHFWTDLPGTILHLLGDAGSWLVNVGKDVLRGFAQGLIQAAQDTVGHIPFIGGDIVKAFKSALGVSSPSTIFAAIGADVIGGLRGGMEAGYPAVGASLAGLSDKMAGTSFGSPGFGPGTGGGLGGGQGGAGGMVVNITVPVTIAGPVGPGEVDVVQRAARTGTEDAFTALLKEYRAS